MKTSAVDVSGKEILKKTKKVAKVKLHYIIIRLCSIPHRKAIMMTRQDDRDLDSARRCPEVLWEFVLKGALEMIPVPGE